ESHRARGSSVSRQRSLGLETRRTSRASRVLNLPRNSASTRSACSRPLALRPLSSWTSNVWRWAWRSRTRTRMSALYPRVAAAAREKSGGVPALEAAGIGGGVAHRLDPAPGVAAGHLVHLLELLEKRHRVGRVAGRGVKLGILL